MNTQVFAHKHFVGIVASPDKAGFISDPVSNKGTFGFVVDARFVDVQPAAMDILKTINKSNMSLGDIDIISTPAVKPEDTAVLFAWIGPSKTIITNKHEGSSIYNPLLMTDRINPNVVTPQDFIDFVDSL